MARAGRRAAERIRLLGRIMRRMSTSARVSRRGLAHDEGVAGGRGGRPADAAGFDADAGTTPVREVLRPPERPPRPRRRAGGPGGLPAGPSTSSPRRSRRPVRAAGGVAGRARRGSADRRRRDGGPPPGPGASGRSGRHPCRRHRREPVHAATRRHGGHPALRTCTVPAKPRWLLAIPDAISQLEQLDRPLLTRRDIERLFGVGKVRAAAAEAPAAAQEAPRPGRVPRRGGETRARGRRAPEGPADRGPVQGARRDHEREAGEPDRRGVGRARSDRGAVDGAEDALARLYSLAQALGNDLARFQALVGR